tara:strand:+ start:409 stop:603 length:195 start_codon:yes stop_codon:yes gene_type:complete
MNKEFTVPKPLEPEVNNTLRYLTKLRRDIKTKQIEIEALQSKEQTVNKNLRELLEGLKEWKMSE